MALFTSPDDILISAMISRQPQVRLEHCMGSLDTIFKNALKKERRLLAFLSGYQSSYMKTGLVQLMYDYDVTIQYQDTCPDSINDVIVDNGDWEAESVLTKGLPKRAIIVTQNPSEISSKLTALLGRMLSEYEGILGWQTSTLSFEKISSDVVCYIDYSYIVSQQMLRQYQGKAVFAAKNIWKKILGRAKVPQFVKPFLALSYLTQECCYDQRAFEEAEGDLSRAPSDPVPHLAYGPLVEGRGICGGLAWAFKILMDDANIECICVNGFLKEDMSIGHMWNLVKMDGQYYHVDPTWGIKEDGVHVSGLMQPDSMFKITHIWEPEHYPQARGMRFDYDFVEDYLAENGNDFLDDGADEKYFFPDEIVE